MAAPIVTTKGRQASLLGITSASALGPITMILMADGHNFQIETDFVSDISGDELVATGITRQPIVFGPINDNEVGVVTIEATPTSFGVLGGGVNGTTSGCYLFADTGDEATSPIYACMPFVTPKTTDGTDFRVTAFTYTWAPVPF